METTTKPADKLTIADKRKPCYHCKKPSIFRNAAGKAVCGELAESLL